MSTSSVPTSRSSGSEEYPKIEMDQRKRKRMISNRESARRSRMRKQQHLEDLASQVASLKNVNSQILTQADVLADQYIRMESENTILRTQLMELAERLTSMNSVLRFVEDSGGMPMDIQEMPDPLLKPWQLPSSWQPIVASADVLQC